MSSGVQQMRPKSYCVAYCIPDFAGKIDAAIPAWQWQSMLDALLNLDLWVKGPSCYQDRRCSGLRTQKGHCNEKNSERYFQVFSYCRDNCHGVSPDRVLFHSAPGCRGSPRIHFWWILRRALQVYSPWLAVWSKCSNIAMIVCLVSDLSDSFCCLQAETI